MAMSGARSAHCMRSRGGIGRRGYGRHIMQSYILKPMRMGWSNRKLMNDTPACRFESCRDHFEVCSPPGTPVGLGAALGPAGALHKENPMTIGIIDLILAAAIIAIALSRREW